MTGIELSKPPPAGIYVPVPTFFASKTAQNYDPISPPVDIDAQVAHSVYLAKAGIRGLVVLGSTGEAIHLRADERGLILAQNIEEVVEQLVVAKESGANWGLVLVPGYFAGCTSQDGLVRWFTAVADRSPLPVMIYHYPGVSNNVKVAPSTYVTLAQHPNIVGCKLSHGDLSHHCLIASNPAIDHEHFFTFTGLGQQLLPVIAVGGAGAIDGSAGFFPRTVVRLYELSREPRPTDEQLSERRRLQFKVSSVEELVVGYGTVGIKEATSRLRGFGDVDGARAPLAAGMGDWEKWDEIISAAEEEERRLGGE
ncbi:unnamed protein product [Parascedosporium putredinis]|uniref:Aldolase n=1 Tax=Parascedosporium putredinis TaxID=1442378 RepID=A0A9P1MA20_9PEZI|nr:unnamed protein product [Parascedosporium putredinis]CAI7995836.1 unnamed protein product [Parascedosporium putredinis]